MLFFIVMTFFSLFFPEIWNKFNFQRVDFLLIPWICKHCFIFMAVVLLNDKQITFIEIGISVTFNLISIAIFCRNFSHKNSFFRVWEH